MSFKTASHSNQFKAIVFDLDGTLLDTLTDIAEAMNQVLSDHGFPSHPIIKYKDFIGNGVDKLIERALPDSIAKPEVIPLYRNAFRAAYAKNWHTTTRPYPGIPTLLTRLSQQDIRLAILSNKAHEFTSQMVRVLLYQWKFLHVLGASTDFPKKTQS